MAIDTLLKQKNITLPSAAAPAANYVPYVVHGNMVYISGQLPLGVGNLADYVGRVGKEFTVTQAQEIARICGLNIIAQVKAACGGNLDQVKQCVRLGVFVSATPEFTDHPLVANGASDLMVEVFGDKGRHTRSTVGVSQLPRGVAVEVDAVFAIA